MRGRKKKMEIQYEYTACWPNTENDWKALKSQNINARVTTCLYILGCMALPTRVAWRCERKILMEDDDNNLEEKPGNMQKA